MLLQKKATNNTEYYIQDIKVKDLCQEYGTPLYVYDGNTIVEQYNKLKNAFAGLNLKIKYACKANTNLSILALMRSLGIELDVVSPQEIRVGMAAGYAPKQIMYTSSGVSFDEIEDAVNIGVMINIDNLSTLEKFGKKYGNTVPCVIRIRPNIAGGGNIKIMTGHKDAKFGIAIEQKDELLRIVAQYQIKVVGLHQHTGSDIKDGKSFTDAAQIILDLAMSFPDLILIDLGGGFKVAYKAGDIVSDMDELGSKLSAAFKEFCLKYGRELQMWLEPGKFLVSECGYLLVSSNVVKFNPNKNLIAVNSGLNHLIRPMMYDAYHEVINISNTDESLKELYDVVGYICETDTFAKDRHLPKTKEGDILAFLNAGAYGFSMASQYNGRPRPAEILVYNNKSYLIRKREEVEDILRNQILVAID